MRIDELTRRKKVQPVYDPIEAARDQLEWYKEKGESARPNGTQQLFVPRKQERYFTKKEREAAVLKNHAAYGYDDAGNITPHYQQWIDQATESIIREGAPIIAGGSPISAGDTKPIGAVLWTSTAKKLSNGKYTSDWWNYILNGGVGYKNQYNQEKIGYLYKVKPRTCSYLMDDSNDARVIYDIFAELGRENTRKQNPTADDLDWIKQGFSSHESLIRHDFPWQHLARHFDCVHHYGGSRYSYDNYGFDFMQGWDVESSVFFKPTQLELLGQVPLRTSEDVDY